MSAQKQKARGDVDVWEVENVFYQSSLRSDWTLALGIRVERAGTVRGADLCRQVSLNFC